MEIINIEIKQRLKEIENNQDYYAKVKNLCEPAGIVAFFGHTINNTQNELKNAEKMARDTINQIIKKHDL